MYVEIKTAIAMIKRRKAQTISLVIIISVTSMLFFAGISLLNMKNPFETMFERAKGSHTLISASSKYHDLDKIYNWFKANSKVENINLYNCKEVGACDNKGEIENVLMFEYLENEYDILYDTDINKVSEPKNKQIYIDTNFASEHNLMINDIVKVDIDGKEFEFIIANIVIDHQFGSSLSSDRVWVKEGFFGENNIDNDYYLGVRYMDRFYEKEVINSYKQFSKEDVPNYIFEYKRIRRGYTVMISLITVALVLLSIILLVIVAIIIRFTISNQIVNNYKEIGIMKNIGFSNKNIIRSYVIQYIIIGIISLAVGIGLGTYYRQILVNDLTKSMNIDVSLGDFIPTIATSAGILMLINIFAILSSKKAIKVKPIQAIKYGMPEDKVNRINISFKLISKFHISIILAIKHIFSNLKSSIVIVISISIILLFSVSVVNISDTFKGQEINRLMMGRNLTNMAINCNDNKKIFQILNYLDLQPEVEWVIYSRYTMGSVYMNDLDIYENVPKIECIGDINKFGYNIIDGRLPMNSSEIIIGKLLSEKINKSVGDYVKVKEKNKKKNVLITGMYESVVEFGQTYTTLEEIDKTEERYFEGQILLSYNDKTTYIELSEKIKTEFGEKGLIFQETTNPEKQSKTITEKLPLVLDTIVVVLLLICSLIIMIWAMMDIKNSTKYFGVLKSIGLSNRDIVWVMVINSIILTSIGCFIGGVIGIVSADEMLEIGYSITSFKMTSIVTELSISSIIYIMLIYIIVSVIATLIAAIRIKKVSPRVLITE